MKTLQAIALTAVAFLAPAKAVIITVAALTMVDLVLGVVASRRRGHKLTSKGLKHSVIKVAVYEVAVLLAYVVQNVLISPELPLMSMLTTLIGLTEMKSCLENLDIIYGEPFFKHMISRLSKLADSEGKDDPPTP